MAAKEELDDCQSEFSALKEDLLDSIRVTDKEIKLADFIIQECVPGEVLLKEFISLCHVCHVDKNKCSSFSLSNLFVFQTRRVS